MADTINEPTLRGLAEAGAIKGACVQGRAGGYVIVAMLGSSRRTLVSARGTERLFSLNNASKYLSAMGMRRFEVDVAEFVPGLMRKARPDRAEALKRTKTKPSQGWLI